MADTLKSSSELKLTWQFADGDTRTQTVKNPDPNLTANDIQSFANDTVTTKAIIGDQTGANVTGVKSAYIQDKTDIFVDIS